MRCAVKGLALIMSLWLVACAARLPFSTSESCLLAADTTARLKVQKKDGQTQYLLLRTEQSESQIVFVALDTIGSPQFSATLVQGRLTVERSPLYRGVDPAALIWGYNWWQTRAMPLTACAESAGVQLHQSATSISLGDPGHPRWQWDAARPLQYDLPRWDTLVSVTLLERK